MKIWNWIRDQNNREALKFIGVAIVTIPTTIFGFVTWLSGNESPSGETAVNTTPIIVEPVAPSGAIRIENQLRQCLNGNVIECQGLAYKNEEAHLRCINDIRDSDAVKRSFANNKCASMKGFAFQIMALAKIIRSNCNSFDSSKCVKARQDAKYHNNKDLSSLASYLEKYN